MAAQAWDTVKSVLGDCKRKIHLVLSLPPRLGPNTLNALRKRLSVGPPSIVDMGDFGWIARKMMVFTTFPWAASLAWQGYWSAQGYRVLRIPHAARVHRQLAEIFTGEYYPLYLEVAASPLFPEGRFLWKCDSSSLQAHEASRLVREFRSAEHVRRPHGGVTSGSAVTRGLCQWNEEEFMLWNGAQARGVSIEELEVLLGLPRFFTSVPNPAAPNKSDKLDM